MTIFERIVAREIPAKIVYEDELAIAFRDIHPQAPVHVLVAPKRAIPRVSSTTEADEALLGHLLTVARRVAELEDVVRSGFRIVINDGSEAGQTVDHLHLHVLGGRVLGWPPG